MTTSQRLALRRSKITQRLNEIAGLNAVAVTPEIRQEADSQADELATVETQYRAVVTAEDAETRAATEDGETTATEDGELRQLRGRAELRAGLDAGAHGRMLEGAELELAQHRGVTDPRALPWDLFDPGDPERRADAISAGPTDVGVTTRAIISRVFARSATRLLGVRMESVGVGAANYPTITAGASPAFTAAEGAKEAETFTITPTELEPTRLQARYSIRRENLHRIGGYEAALRSGPRHGHERPPRRAGDRRQRHGPQPQSCTRPCQRSAMTE